MSDSGAKEADVKPLSGVTYVPIELKLPPPDFEGSEKHGLTPILERFYTSKEYAVRFCTFLQLRKVQVTVEEASEIAIIIAKYLAKIHPTNPSRSQDEIDSINAVKEQIKPISKIDPKAKQGPRVCSVLETDVIDALQVVLAEEGFKLDIDETKSLLMMFEEFSRASARAAWVGVVVEDEKDDWGVVKMKDGKGMADKGMGKETGSGVKGEEEIDGHS